MNKATFAFSMMIMAALLVPNVETLADSRKVKPKANVFDIPSQDVGTALNKFAAQSGLQIVFYTLIGKDLKSHAISGDFPSQSEALTKLLTGTGLRFWYLNESTVVVQLDEKSLDAALQEKTEPEEPVVTDRRSRQKGLKEIDELFVTARKRREYIQDVPISITAFTEDDIVKKSFVSLKDLGQFTPNLSFFNGVSGGRFQSSVFIRGVGQDDSNDASRSPGVGVYIDGIFLGRMQGLDLELMDVERVEVLRGPQGTLYGKNTIGGAINMVSVKPDSEEFSGTVNVTLGELDRLDGKLSVNIPIVPGTLAASLAISSRRQDGYGKQIDFTTGQTLVKTGDTDRLSGSASFYWTPTNTFDALLVVDSSKVRETGTPRTIIQYFEQSDFFVERPYNSIVAPPVGNHFLTHDDFNSYAAGPSLNEFDGLGASLTLNWDLESLIFKSITGYRDSEAMNFVDPDGTPHLLVEAKHEMRFDQFTQEFQLGGLSLYERLNWVLGFYYFEEDVHNPFKTQLAGELYHVSGIDLGEDWEEFATSESRSVFGQGTYSLTDQLNLTLGARYTEEKKTFAAVERTFFDKTLVDIEPEQDDNYYSTTGRLGFEYHWSEHLMGYFSVARGFLSGGFNNVNEEGKPFDDEILTTYEIGVRYETLDSRLLFNVTAFYSDYKDIQIEVTAAGTDLQPVSFIGNAGKARVKGFELDLRFLPSENLTVTAALGHIEAEYQELDSGAPISTSDDFALTPRWSGTLSAEYLMSLGKLGDLGWRADFSYKSAVEHNLPANPFVRQGAYGLLNTRLTYVPTEGDRSWEIALFGTNITDERYVLSTSNFSGLGFVDAQYAKPREWGIDFKYRF